MIEIQNISFGYKNRQLLFNDLSLHLEPGHIYGLLGKNGAGKSTLLKHLCGLRFAHKGTCKVFGFDTRERHQDMLRDIFIIPDEFELPSVNVMEFVKINHGFYPQFSREQLIKYLGEFEISTDSKLPGLSHGQKKKFLIAFGLATNARLLLLDEPTNGLDIPSKSQFRKTLSSIMTEDKIIVISTHYVRDLESLIDYVVVLENGKIIFSKDLMNITEQLAFDNNLQSVPVEDILYFEEKAGRKAGIFKNRDGMETKVDLEMLFNGVITQGEKINSNF